MNEDFKPPILSAKYYDAASVFTPEALLHQAQRQKSGSLEPIPDICLLDPDGDILRRLKSENRATAHKGWMCYHTELFTFEENGLIIGIVGCVVGAPFAVLVAEELFACGCKLLISITSSGQISPAQTPPYFILIDRALRDEGTSYHYQPAAEFSAAAKNLIESLEGAFDTTGIKMLQGATWTTDAPFRETKAAITLMQQRGLLAVEMETAALYAFATARNKPVICFAHVTNQMGQTEVDFEKGDAEGSTDALKVIVVAARRLLPILNVTPE